ncbi:MAG TPA: hypothetical protein VI299_30110, partial [Polyangiales bacterium]
TTVFFVDRVESAHVSTPCNIDMPGHHEVHQVQGKGRHQRHALRELRGPERAGASGKHAGAFHKLTSGRTFPLK